MRDVDRPDPIALWSAVATVRGSQRSDRRCRLLTLPDFHEIMIIDDY
jgi:hypothetical protein